jgi:hypothetical protein
VEEESRATGKGLRTRVNLAVVLEGPGQDDGANRVRTGRQARTLRKTPTTGANHRGMAAWRAERFGFRVGLAGNGRESIAA